MNLALPMPRVVVETERIIVVSKHAGWALNANDRGRHSGYFHHIKSVLLDDRPGIDLFPCHRLDRCTSGCLLMAKDIETARTVNQQFSAPSGRQDQRDRVHKTYVALSNRKPKKKMGRIVGDMEKSRRGSWKLSRQTTNPAVTTFESTSYLSACDDRRLYFFVVRPLTGRTHQIRVALKSVGAPILGDERYANSTDASGYDRAYLHSATMSFKLPGDEKVDVICRPEEEDGMYFADEAFNGLWNKSFP